MMARRGSDDHLDAVVSVRDARSPGDGTLDGAQHPPSLADRHLIAMATGGRHG
jgi:hypothetical protein